MVEPLHLRNIAWALTSTVELALLVYLVRRRLYRTHPAFCVYILTAILQSVVVFFVYRFFGFTGSLVRSIAWASQVVVVFARGAAVFEIARRTLSAYSGIWALAWRVLLCVGAAVLLYSALASNKIWFIAILNADRAAELAIASVIVTLLLFARYYRLTVDLFERSLAVGFCLYSCFHVINDSLLEKWLFNFATLWTFLDVLAFLATLIIWFNAVRAYSEPEYVRIHIQVSKELYGKLSVELNLRLRLLNDQLNHPLRSGDQRS